MNFCKELRWNLNTFAANLFSGKMHNKCFQKVNTQTHSCMSHVGIVIPYNYNLGAQILKEHDNSLSLFSFMFQLLGWSLFTYCCSLL